MIWGRTLQPGQLYTEQLNEGVHLSLAALESRQEDGNAKDKSYSQVVLATEEAEQLLCTLVHGVIFQQCLDLELMPDEKVTFKVQGSSAVYITGYTIKTPQMQNYYLDNVQDTEYSESIDYDMGDEVGDEPELEGGTAIHENVCEQDAEYSESIINFEVGDEPGIEEGTDICEQGVPEQEDIVIKAEMEDCVFVDEASDTIGAERLEEHHGTGIIPCQSEDSTAALHQHANHTLALAVTHDNDTQGLSTLNTDQRLMLRKVPVTTNCTTQSSNDSRQELLTTPTGMPSLTCSAKRQSNAEEQQQLSTTSTDKRFLGTTHQFQSRSRGTLQISTNHIRRGLQHHNAQSYGTNAKTFSASGLDQNVQNENDLEENSMSFQQPVNTSHQTLVGHERQSLSYYNVKQSPAGSSQHQAVKCNARTGHDAQQQGGSLQSAMEVSSATTGHTELETKLPLSGSIQTPRASLQASTSIGKAVSTRTYLPTIGGGRQFSTANQPVAGRVSKTKTTNDNIFSSRSVAQSAQSFQAYNNRAKSYLCGFCNKDCHRAGSLLRHERTHTGVKPFKCLYCRKGFADRSNKVKHERIHTGVKPFKCEQCGNAYSDPSAKRRHQESCFRRTANSNKSGETDHL